jgi:hypothetical protein
LVGGALSSMVNVIRADATDEHPQDCNDLPHFH